MRFKERIRVVLVLMVGMMALGSLTWGIGKIYLELVSQSQRVATEGIQTINTDGNSGTSTGTSTGTGTVLSLPKVTFWTCQVGVFQNEKNAQARQEQLVAWGFNAEVISTNPWAIGIGLGHTVEDLKELRQTLTEKGVSTVPKQVVLPERTFRVAGNGAQLTVELLSNVHTLLRDGLNPTALAQEQQVWEAQAGSRPPADLSGLHQLYCQVREKTAIKEQVALGLSLYSESQRVINKFSGK